MSKILRALKRWGEFTGETPPDYVHEVRSPVPPEPEPEVIDPKYPAREYRLEDTGQASYYIQYKEEGSNHWFYLQWYDTRSYYKNYFQHGSVYLLGDDKSNMKMPEKMARAWAQRDARHHYEVWKQKQKAGAIIHLGKLP